MSIDPAQKYQNEGGPSSTDVARTLKRIIPDPRPDLVRFADALIFNWLIAGTDAHAKNYSMLLHGNGVRLAPLYDISSALPYGDVHIRRLRLAMKFAGYYLVAQGSRHMWAKVANEVGLPEDIVIERARALTAAIPDAFADAARAPEIARLDSTMPTRLTDAVAARLKDCAAVLP